MTDAEGLARKHLGVPPVEELVKELAETNDLARRKRVQQVIEVLAGAPVADQQEYRDAIVGGKHMGSRDWNSRLAEAKKKLPIQARARPVAPRYTVEGGCLFLRDEHPEPQMIAQFIPKVIADVIRDDGAERVQVIRIQVTLPGGRTGETDVSPSRLGEASVWAVAAAGPSAVVMAVPRADAHVRAAAQIFGADHERIHIYAHTGWASIDGSWRFLTTSGALGATDLDTSITVDLGTETLNRYHLPDPGEATAEELRAAVRASLDLRKIAAPEVTIPQLAAAYRAPLPLMPDSTVFVLGLTGKGKSTYAALTQQHFGAGLDHKHLPGNWASTGNSLEATAFTLAGVLYTVDDYNPVGSVRDQAEMRHAAERLIRGAANSAGRSRLRRDGTPQPARPPRAQVLATGEDLPPGHSLRARLTVTELAEEVIPAIKASGVQKLGDDGVFALAMAGYVRYLAGRYDELPDFERSLRDIFTTTRNEMTRGSGHRRAPEAAASLLLGFGTWLAYAHSIGAVTDQERDELYEEARCALLAVAAVQDAHQHDADPVRIFGRALHTAVTTGAAHLASVRDGGDPRVEHARRWGWSPVSIGELLDVRPNGKCIGWISRDGEVYLDSGAAHAVAVEQAGKAGTSLSFSQIAMRKRLNEAGLLAATDGKNLQVVRTVVGERKRVLFVKWDALSGDAIPDDGAPQGGAGE